MAKITFEMPKGDEELDGLKDGEKIQVAAVVRKEPDGKYCLVSVNGEVIPGYSDSDEEEEEVEEGHEEGAPEGEMGFDTMIDETLKR